MDWSGVLLGFASGVAGLAVWTFAVEPWARGRLGTHEYHAYLRSPAWADLCARFYATRRGSRCAACGTTTDLAEPHHWTYRCLGFESLWMLVRFCRRHHTGRWSVHAWSEWVFSSRTRALVLTTGAVCGAGKLGQLARRLRPRRRITSPTVAIPGKARDGDWLLLPDGRVMQRTGSDWQQLS